MKVFIKRWMKLWLVKQCLPIPFFINFFCRKKQMGGIVTQEKNPLRFFRKHFTETEHWYLIREHKLLLIVEILIYFYYILLGHQQNCRNRSHELNSPKHKVEEMNIVADAFFLSTNGKQSRNVRASRLIVAVYQQISSFRMNVTASPLLFLSKPFSDFGYYSS